GCARAPRGTGRIETLTQGQGVILRAVVLPERYTVKRQNQGRVLDTSHIVTEVIVTEDGDTYARGIMRHRPEQSWRNPDHVAVKLGDRKTWYRLVKNTVEATRPWSIAGNVD